SRHLGGPTAWNRLSWKTDLPTLLGCQGRLSWGTDPSSALLGCNPQRWRAGDLVVAVPCFTVKDAKSSICSIASYLRLCFLCFLMLTTRKEGTTAVRSDGEVEGNGEMAAAGNDCCRGGLGCGCVATTRVASSGGGLHGYAEEEQRMMTAGTTTGCSGRGEKEVKEATVAAEVVGKKRRQRPTMGGSGDWRPEVAAAMVKKAYG
ncbi:hypothetical protein B296_00017888, partial [Ensete ventricosum]